MYFDKRQNTTCDLAQRLRLVFGDGDSMITRSNRNVDCLFCDESELLLRTEQTTYPMMITMSRISRLWHGSRCVPLLGRRALGPRNKVRSGPVGRWGLTLIEILIATTLMATLLVALWRLVGIYTSLRDKGDLHAGRVGNVSLMLQQLEEDLRNMPDIRSHVVPLVQTAEPCELELESELETGPVASEADAFAEAYDDEPATETVSESAFELDRAERGAAAASQDIDMAVPDGRGLESSATAGMDQFNTEPSVRQPLEIDSARTEGAGPGQTAASCLVGDEQSLTLANLDCQVARANGGAAEPYSPDMRAEHGLSQESPASELAGTMNTGPAVSALEPELGVTVQMPVRFVRYWLAGVMPYVAHEAAGEYDRDDAEAIGLSVPELGAGHDLGTSALVGASGPMATAGGNEPEEAATGLYREEVVGLNTQAQMRPLRSQGSLSQSSLEDLADPLGDYTNPAAASGLEAPGFSNPYESDLADEVTRRSFHLAQVEWAKFRYFDGNHWKSSWDSRVQGELPVAIEMSLWLLRQSANRSSGETDRDSSRPSATGMTWTEVETMSEEEPQRSAGHEDWPAAEADGEQASLADESPMERQPEVRQLVVLRTAPVSGDTLPGEVQLRAGAKPALGVDPAPASSVLTPHRDASKCHGSLGGGAYLRTRSIEDVVVGARSERKFSRERA